jgi:hypothetical protein
MNDYLKNVSQTEAGFIKEVIKEQPRDLLFRG